MSLLAARRGSIHRPSTDGGGGGGFDPLSIAWDLAFWPEGAEFTALGLADAASVSTWPDESGNARDATQGTASVQPVYRASTAAFNSQPTVEFSGDWMSTAAFTAITAGDVFFVGLATANTSFFFGGDDSSHRWDFNRNYTGSSTHDWRIHNGGGAIFATSAADSNAHAFRLTFDATDVINVDGVDLASGSAGSDSLDGLYLGRYFASGDFLNGHIAFLGVKDGGLTSTERSDLLAWAQSHYGTP